LAATIEDDLDLDISTTTGVSGEALGGSLSALVVGAGIFATYPLGESPEITIGRGADNGIVIQHGSVSRHHAVIRLGPPVTIEDLGSANGTSVRGAWLAPGEPATLNAGEVVELGALMLILQQRTPPSRRRRLWSHDYFEGHLEEECARAERTSHPFAVLHIRCAVDAPARLVQQVFAESLRTIDVAGIYSPGHFEVLLVEAPPAQAEQLQKRVGELLASCGVPARLGLACYPLDGTSADALLASAGDRALAEHEVVESRSEVEILGESMQQLHRVVERIASSTITVLILGETGVGKEVLAERLHCASPRAHKPFLRLNCAALSESLLESELFGHERGAFTGAVQAKPGLLETADGGTIFLDEIGELPMATQVKLLRVLEERMVLRVGSVTPRPIDVRFVAATNRDLEAEIARGWFRRDLYFRLNSIALSIPPLRERVSEIQQLAESFLVEICRRLGRTDVPKLAPAALACLKSYGWPGNIRELRNVMERAALLCTGDIVQIDHLPLEKMQATLTALPAKAAPPPVSLEGPTTVRPATAGKAPGRHEPPLAGAERMREQMAAFERECIIEALNRCGGNQTHAARALGISRSTLIKRIIAMNITRPRKRPEG
jgi:DNA-binding NtrC family response regulator